MIYILLEHVPISGAVMTLLAYHQRSIWYLIWCETTFPEHRGTRTLHPLRGVNSVDYRCTKIRLNSSIEHN